MYRLSDRLQAIYDELLPGQPVWDTCCDHGKIGLNAHESGNFPEVHCVDQVPEIIEGLRQRATEYLAVSGGSFENLFFHSGSAANLQQQILGTFVIAGVGAHTVIEILESLLGQNNFQPSRIIVSSHNKIDFNRQWLEQNLTKKSFNLSKHKLVNENGRIREILIFDLISPT